MHASTSSDSKPSKRVAAKRKPKKPGKTPTVESSGADTLHLKKTKQVYAASTPSDIAGMIATAAYYLAERRHFESGHELEDWLTAERQIQTLHS